MLVENARLQLKIELHSSAIWSRPYILPWTVHCRRRPYRKNVPAVRRYTTIGGNLFRNDDDQKCDVFLDQSSYDEKCLFLGSRVKLWRDKEHVYLFELEFSQSYQPNEPMKTTKLTLSTLDIDVKWGTKYECHCVILLKACLWII